MSPEQFLGNFVDRRTGIYSAGAVLFQMLTGERPHEGGLATIMHKVLQTEPPRPSTLSPLVPPALDRVVGWAMAKKPEDRFASVAAFNVGYKLPSIRLWPLWAPPAQSWLLGRTPSRARSFVVDARDANSRRRGFCDQSTQQPHQYLRAAQVARWDFDVRPLRPGRRVMRVLVSLRIMVEGKDELVDLPSYEREILVRVAPLHVTAEFCGKNWQWIAGSVAISPDRVDGGSHKSRRFHIATVGSSVTSSKPVTWLEEMILSQEPIGTAPIVTGMSITRNLGSAAPSCSC
jgi:hypothetical protein